MTEFAYPLPVAVICALLGVPAADRTWFRQQAADLTGVLEPEITVEELAAADRGTAALRDYFGELVAARRRTPADDLTTALVQAHDADGDRLSGDELLANLVLLLVAGFETTTNLLGNGLVVLLGHPERRRRAARRSRRWPPATSRSCCAMTRPVQLTTRLSTEPVSRAGVSIPAGSWLLLLLGAANRDPERFPEPDRFDPGRAQTHPLSFGAGPHYCLGAALARLEAQVAFPLLLRGVPRPGPGGGAGAPGPADPAGLRDAAGHAGHRDDRSRYAGRGTAGTP